MFFSFKKIKIILLDLVLFYYHNIARLYVLPVTYRLGVS